MTSRIIATYHIRAAASEIEARARGVAVEQSVEMPVEAIDDPAILREIVGRVEHIAEIGHEVYEVRIGLAAATTGFEAGQLLNMLFGNSSIQDDVVLIDLDLTEELVAAFGGPGPGVAGLRARVGAEGRALTCSALKPQGLSPSGLADLARRMAEGGLDYIKDDHGLADQAYSRVAARVAAVAPAVAGTGRPTRYLPSLSGTLDELRRQIGIARDHGLDGVLVAPLIVGLPSFHRIRREFPEIAIMAHPAMAGAARIAPPLLIGKLFRLLGADAVVFPNYGGRFGYSPETCRLLAANALGAVPGLRPSLPVPAGGMVLSRVPELLDFYGADAMLLIGGNLLAAGSRLSEEAAAFARAVAAFDYSRPRPPLEGRK